MTGREFKLDWTIDGGVSPDNQMAQVLFIEIKYLESSSSEGNYTGIDISTYPSDD